MSQAIIEPEGLGYAGPQHWTPPDGVTEHSGRDIAPERDFFAPPPAEIGKIESAYTTLKSTKAPWAAPSRFAFAGTVAAVIAFAIYYFVSNMGGRNSRDLTVVAIPVGIGALIGFGIVWWATRFKHTCSYVGELGLARFVCKGSRDNISKSDVLLFADAEELRTSQTRHYTNGVYTGTTYEFTWTDPAGMRRLKLDGSHNGKNDLPKPDDPFHFAHRGEIQWSIYRLQKLPDELEKNGYVQFNLRPGEFVRVGPGFFEFCLKREVTRITVDEIKVVNLNQGRFSIHSKDVRWFSSQGKFGFDYAKMANARLFLLAMEKLVGYTFN